MAFLTVPFIRPTLGAGSHVAAMDEGLQPPGQVVDQDAIARRDLDLLQGTWYRVSSEVEGKKVPLSLPPKDPALMIVFKGDGWYGMDRDRKTLVQGHVVRLNTTRRPKAIDLYNLGPNRNPCGSPIDPGNLSAGWRHPDPLPELRRRRPSYRIRNQGWREFVLARRLPA